MKPTILLFALGISAPAWAGNYCGHVTKVETMRSLKKEGTLVSVASKEGYEGKFVLIKDQTDLNLVFSSLSSEKLQVCFHSTAGEGTFAGPLSYEDLSLGY